MSNENKPEELMPCPLPDCGAEVQAALAGPVFCTECRYQAPSVEVHDRFTRLAEIGALVERVIGCQCDIDVQLFIGGSGRHVGLEDECGNLMSYTGDTLLDSLRALAAEIGGGS